MVSSSISPPVLGVSSAIFERSKTLSRKLSLPASVSSAQVRRSSILRSTVPSNGAQQEVVPASVPVRVAYELLQAGHHYLDIRTVDEFSAGHPDGAMNVPYMFKVGSGMMKNPRFVEEVSSIFGKDDEIIIGCESGKRSLMASAELLYAGFTGITDIEGGFLAWAQIGLPTE